MLLLTCVLPMASQQTRQRPAPASGPEARIEQLLRQMTIEEKVGQMTQVTIDVVSVPNAVGRNHRLDPAKLEEAILKWKVGSILNVNGEAYTVEHWHEVLNQIQDVVEKSRLKIPVLYGIDSIHGANYTLDAVLFPNAISAAATWNVDLVKRAAEISAFQTRASGIPWTFYPVEDIGRQPLWPRFFETFGEDVHLASRLVTAYVEGLQGRDISARDKVAACVKHYAGYSMPFNGKDRTPAILDERTLRQVILPPYEAAVRAGAPTVMVNSGEISGVPGHANSWLIQDVLKKEWGFRGFVVSDWEDIKRLHTRDRVAPTPKDAVRIAVMAGVDMSMVPYDFSFAELLLQCVKEGSVPVSRIDDAVRRILRVKMQLGLFDRPRPDASMKAEFDKPEFHEANLQAAREALVLLKNEGLLPLAKGRRILVTGPNADLLSVLNGGWSLTWQGNREDLFPKNKLTIRKAIEQWNGAANTQYVKGVEWEKAADINAAVKAAEAADVVVAVLGEPSYCETPGNIEDLALPEPQIRLIEALAQRGKPIVTVLVGGRPRVLRTITRNSKAILWAGLPGNEGGRAVAEVLFGDVNPSGKLPFSYPRNVNGFTTYDYKPLENTHDNPTGWEFPFGHGLSYTKFDYSDLKLSANTMTRTGSITISVKVRNSGSRAGKEVVQLYVSDLYRQVSPPNRELKGFQKIELAPGEEKTVEFQLAAKDLAFVGLNNRWTLEPGDYRVQIANLTAGFTLR
ncbi:MAG: glycoside hydrolase family 3 C-terminal domain-containing protein [Bryobacteraceae bacterium]|nr:glycoside hydrolase family 3 C-terminal domain-containing protein [Bryobacteraceae bacterium]